MLIPSSYCVYNNRAIDGNGRTPIEVTTNDKIKTMLKMQKKHILAKAQGTMINGKLIDELHFKLPMIYKGIEVPCKPPKISGYIYKIGKVLGGKNRRYFQMNPVEKTFTKYIHKEACPTHPKEVFQLADITNLILCPNKDPHFHYFEVELDYTIVCIR